MDETVIETHIKECDVEDPNKDLKKSNEVNTSPIYLEENQEEIFYPWWSLVYQNTLKMIINQVLNPKQKSRSQYNNQFLRYIDNFFHMTSLKSNFYNEIVGGFTTFLTASYIMSVNPNILSVTGMSTEGTFMATSLVAGFGTLAMGLFAGVPFIVAPAMGYNTLFAYTLVEAEGYKWESALGLCLIMGIVDLIIVAFGARRSVINAIPDYFRIGMAVGIALWLGFIGSSDMKLIVSNTTTLIGVGKMTWELAVGLLCLLIMAGLILRGYKSAFIIAIISTSILMIILKAIIEPDDLVLGNFGDLNMSSVAGRLNFDFNWKALYIIPLLLIQHLFDSVGTILVLLRQAYFSNSKISLNAEDFEESLTQSKKVRNILIVDAFILIFCPILGTSPSTTFIESATGISVGARTGVASSFAGICFLLSIFVGPIINYISLEATGPALIITAVILMTFLRNLDFDNKEETFPALFTVMMIPFTYSVASGSALGYCFMLSWIIAGKWKKMKPAMIILVIVSIFQVISTLLYSL